MYINPHFYQGYIPGNIGFDPLNLYSVKGNKKTMELAEIKNGRLGEVPTDYVKNMLNITIIHNMIIIIILSLFLLSLSLSL